MRSKHQVTPKGLHKMSHENVRSPVLDEGYGLLTSQTKPLRAQFFWHSLGHSRSNNMKCFLLFGLWLGCMTSSVWTALSTNATPPYIKPCHKSDPELNACIKSAFEHLRPYLIKGIPEIKLQSIEPLRIPKMVMDNGNGAVRVRAQFSNITVYGATNYSIIDVKGNVTTYKIELSLGIPRIESTGNYEVNGNVLLFPVRSRGDFWALFSNITGSAKIYGREITKNGSTFMKIEKLLVDFKLNKSRFKIRDFLNGHNVLGEAMNQFLNQNSNEIIEEMKPAATAAIAKHFKNFLNGAFLQVPVPVWLKD